MNLAKNHVRDQLRASRTPHEALWPVHTEIERTAVRVALASADDYAVAYWKGAALTGLAAAAHHVLAGRGDG